VKPQEIGVPGKSSRVSDALRELNPAQIEQLEPIVERVVKRIVKRVVDPPRRLMTIRQFAEHNNIGLTLAYIELNSGRLEAIKVGTKTMITPEAQVAWLSRLPRYKPADATIEELESA
jgi:hypothetical protein